MTEISVQKGIVRRTQNCVEPSGFQATGRRPLLQRITASFHNIYYFPIRELGAQLVSVLSATDVQVVHYLPGLAFSQ